MELKRIIMISLTALVLLMMSSCIDIRVGPPGPSEKELRGPQIFTGGMNTSISSGVYTACYGDCVFYFDNAAKGLKALNTSTSEEKLIYPVDAVSHIAVNDEYVFFVSGRTIYQIDYYGNLMDTNDRLEAIGRFAVLSDTLYVNKNQSGGSQGQYSLPVDNINSDPVPISSNFDYDSVEFTKISGTAFGNNLVYVEQIDERNSLIISVAKNNDRLNNVLYTLVQDGFGIYGDWLMLDGNANVYFCNSTWAASESGIFGSSDGMKIELPNEHEYLSLCKSNASGRFVLLGKNFGPAVRNGSSQPASYHQSDILLEIDTEAETAETLIKTGKGERIISYWNGKVLLLKGDAINVFDPASGKREELYLFKKAYPDSNLNLCVLNGYLFVYEEDNLVLMERLAF